MQRLCVWFASALVLLNACAPSGAQPALTRSAGPSPYATTAAGLPFTDPATGRWHSVDGATAVVGFLNADFKMTLHRPALLLRGLAGQRTAVGYYLIVPATIELVTLRTTMPSYVGGGACRVKDQAGVALDVPQIDSGFSAALNAKLGMTDLLIDEKVQRATGILVYESRTRPSSVTVDCSLPYRGPLLDYPPEALFEWQPR